MLGTYAVKDIQNPALEVGDDHVHPGEKRGRVPGVFLDIGLVGHSRGRSASGKKASRRS